MKHRKKEDYEGLRGWANDYRKVRESGNVTLAKQIHINIEKRRKKTGFAEREIYF
jgi:hypothetical protein